jgi:hypothetical protein
MLCPPIGPNCATSLRAGSGMIMDAAPAGDRLVRVQPVASRCGRGAAVIDPSPARRSDALERR